MIEVSNVSPPSVTGPVDQHPNVFDLSDVPRPARRRRPVQSAMAVLLAVTAAELFVDWLWQRRTAVPA